MKKSSLIVLVLLILGLIALIFFSKERGTKILSPIGKEIKEKPLSKYSFENLKKTQFNGSPITIGKLVKDDTNFSSYMFYFNDGKYKVSGLLNLPKKEGIYPVIVMFRGYVDKEVYSPGEGTRASGEEFARNGFITLAPDFLGYGESDNPKVLNMEDRFKTYTTALSLFASVKNLNKALEENNINVKADSEKIGIWGHSNGGHIALSVMAISGKNYPIVLWAPVSKPFPYSILYFTDEYSDHGKSLRRATSIFEEEYDAEKYSPTNYYSWIKAPIQLHQGTADESVPQRWSDQLYNDLKGMGKDIEYFTYPGENHNFNNGSWSTAISRSIDFFKSHFE